MSEFLFNLQYFAEDGGDAAAAPAGGDAGGVATGTETAESSQRPIQAGDTLSDGTQLSAQAAAAMEKQLKRHPEMRERYFGQNGQPANPPQQVRV